VNTAKVVDLGAPGTDPEGPRLGDVAEDSVQHVDDVVLAHHDSKEQVDGGHVAEPGALEIRQKESNGGSNVEDANQRKQSAVDDSNAPSESSGTLAHNLVRYVDINVLLADRHDGLLQVDVRHGDAGSRRGF
jgi:hypothetical protein